MNRGLAVACLAAVSVAVPPALTAQWVLQPATGIPRTPDGKPNLDAPTPRTADGKPDLSGVWANPWATGGGRGRGAAPPPKVSLDAIPEASFGNVGVGFTNGLPLQPWAADLLKKRMADNSKDNPDAHCLPMGFMQFHEHPQFRKILQAPGVFIIIYEANYGLRQIFMDQRSVPKDPEPWWYGYSLGKWEGDTLVVQTTGFTDDIWLDINGSPLTSAGKTIERFRRLNYGTLEIEVTVDDPKAYTRPWTVKVTQRIAPDTELNEFICEERDAPHYVGAKK
jgi:hypothetical protein